MLLKDAIGGFAIAKLADGYSQTTIKMYESRLNLLVKWLKNPDINEVTTKDLRRFLYYLRTDYNPQRPGGDQSKLTDFHGYWKAIRCLWKWAAEEMEIDNPAIYIKAQRYKLKPIVPLTKSGMVLLLQVCEKDEQGRKRST